MIFYPFYISAGGWGAWGNYSVCSVTCGNGTQVRTRLCDTPPPQYGGAYCVGSNSSTLTCTKTKCPAVGNYYIFLQIENAEHLKLGCN